jgi:hypothetical protein
MLICKREIRLNKKMCGKDQAEIGSRKGGGEAAKGGEQLNAA